MRLTSPTPNPGDTPESWIASLRHAGYTAGNAPVSPGGAPEAAAYAHAARAAGIVIASTSLVRATRSFGTARTRTISPTTPST